MHITCTVFIPRLIVLVISCFTFFAINKKIGIVIALSVFIQYFLISRGLSDCVDTTYNEHMKKDKMYDYIEDLLSNINTVQSTVNGYEYEMKTLNEITDRIKASENKTSKCINNKQYKSFASNIVIFSFIFYTIFTLHKSGELSNEQTTTVILLVIGLFENMSDMSYFIPEFTLRFGILKSNDNFLKELILKSNTPKYGLNKLEQANVEFDNVTFKYGTNDNNNYIFKNFSLRIPENQIVSIYGKSGSGKTTFIKLLFGVEKPISGNILLDGKNINDYDIKDIRKYISYTNQDTNTLFNKSIISNIIYGKEYTPEEYDKVVNTIKNTFEEFKLYDIFKNLDKGKPKWSFLNETVGKLGGRLSGGQKKIIHLLRLELNDVSKLVIMDEPTSSVDDVTRNNIINFIKHLSSKGKSLIIITHDEYFKNISDKVLQFNDNQNPVYIK